jgi:uncharacterized iron-regulated membrane protein
VAVVMHSTAPPLRKAMDYLHTWAGVLCTSVLFLIFFMGTLAVFMHEIDRWMMPATRVATAPAFSFDRHALPHLRALAPDAVRWYASPPNDRQPYARLFVESRPEESRDVKLDTAKNRLIAEPGSEGASGFFYPFHYMLHLPWWEVGIWIVGIAAVAMLVLLVSGIVIHRKFFDDFFTLRIGRNTHRATLDLHNVSSVLLLPFHFVITFSGLVIFLAIYLGPALWIAYGEKGRDAYYAEAYSGTRPARSGHAAPLVAIDALVARAEASWADGTRAADIDIALPGDARSRVSVYPSSEHGLVNTRPTFVFSGSTGALIETIVVTPTQAVQGFFDSVHRLPFVHWWLRWVYFAMGLGACVMIATGLLLWVEKRRARHQRSGQTGTRIVAAIAIAGSLGLVVATLSMLVANKLLPAPSANAWSAQVRAVAEQIVFFGTWTISLVHAAWRSRTEAPSRVPWREQAWVCAVLAVLAVMLNGALTGDHLFAALVARQWAVAGTDGVLLFGAALAAWAAQRLRGAAVRAATEAADEPAAALGANAPR